MLALHVNILNMYVMVAYLVVLLLNKKQKLIEDFKENKELTERITNKA